VKYRTTTAGTPSGATPKPGDPGAYSNGSNVPGAWSQVVLSWVGRRPRGTARGARTPFAGSVRAFVRAGARRVAGTAVARAGTRAGAGRER
jgi:hypothetical protein